MPRRSNSLRLRDPRTIPTSQPLTSTQAIDSTPSERNTGQGAAACSALRVKVRRYSPVGLSSGTVNRERKGDVRVDRPAALKAVARMITRRAWPFILRRGQHPVRGDEDRLPARARVGGRRRRPRARPNRARPSHSDLRCVRGTVKSKIPTPVEGKSRHAGRGNVWARFHDRAARGRNLGKIHGESLAWTYRL